MKTKFNFTKRLLTIVFTPCLLICIVLCLTSTFTMLNNMRDEMRLTLQAVINGAQNTLEHVNDEELTVIDGELYKGPVQVAKLQNIVDNYKHKNGVDVTFFLGDVRILTSIPDALGTKADEKVSNIVLEGKSYYATNVSVNGSSYSGYYVPLKQGCYKCHYYYRPCYDCINDCNLFVICKKNGRFLEKGKSSCQYDYGRTT